MGFSLKNPFSRPQIGRPPSNTAATPKLRKTVLVAWELGGGNGHVSRLLPIAKELQARGHNLVFALRQLATGAAIPGAQIVQAPIFRRPPGDDVKAPACNYADVLHLCGYDSPMHLRPIVAAWHRLIDAVKPALILCDHSPTPILAAAKRIPVVHIGSGFATPPVGKPFLTLRPSAIAGAGEREAQVLETIHATQAYHALPAPAAVPDLLGFAQNFTCTLPELDPYQRVRQVSAIGPIETLPRPAPPPDKPFIFGYLTGEDVRTVTVLAQLALAKIPAAVYLRKSTPACALALTGSSVVCFDHPQDLPQMLRSSSAVLHHGGLATTEMALAIGRPQFIFPRHLEQVLTANAIERLGCGCNLRRDDKTIHNVLQNGATSAFLGQSCAKISHTFTPLQGNTARETVIAACIAMA